MNALERRFLEVVDQAFALGGPVHRVFGEHRPEQSECARRTARALIRKQLVPAEDRVCLTLGQIDPGVGKTLAYEVVLFLYVILFDRRVVVSTFTRALRDDIANAELQCNVAAIVREVIGDQFRPVTVAESKSATSFASPSRADWLRRHLRKLPIDSLERVHGDEYLRWLTGGGRELADWLEHPASDGRYPLKLTELDLCLTEDELGGDGTEPMVAAFRQSVEKLADADIIVVTHAKLLRDVLAYGQSLGTRGVQATALLIDEADRLPAVARTMTDRSIPLSFIAALLDDAPRHLARPAKAALKALNKHLSAAYADRPLWKLLSRDDYYGVVELVTPLVDVLIELQEYYAAKRDQWHLDPLMQVIEALSLFTVTRDKGGTRSDPAYQILNLTNAVPVVEYVPDRDNIRIGVRPMFPSSRIINRLWRQRKSFRYESIIFMSGTMFGLSRNFATIKRRLGINDKEIIDRKTVDWVNTQDEMVLSPKRFGQISRFIVAGRDKDVPLPSVNEPRVAPDGAVDYINQEHVTYSAAALKLLAADPQSARILMLFASEAALQKVLAEVAPLLGDRVIVQSAGQHAETLMPRYAARRDAIWLGLNWEGVNFVDPVTKRTLPGTVIIAKIPIMPADPLQEDEYGTGVSLEDRLDEAARRLFQGVCRGLRHKDDVIGLVILDKRWPLPSALVDALGEPVSALGIDDDEEAAKGSKTFYTPLSSVIPQRLFEGETILDEPAMGVLDMQGEAVTLRMK